MSSVADLFVAQMQDWLALGGESRMNVPGVLGHGNWCWRMLPGALTDELRPDPHRRHDGHVQPVK